MEFYREVIIFVERSMAQRFTATNEPLAARCI
jgi:hypothetical protein